MLNTRLFRNAVTIPAGTSPEWVRIVPIGSFPQHPDGPHEVTFQHIQEMARNFSRTATELLIDLEHKSLTDDSRAVGWSNAVEARTDGLYARYPVWTDYGRPFIEGRDYRYFSPVYTLSGRDKQGRNIGAQVLSVAITNTPYMNEGEIDAIVNGGRSGLLTSANRLSSTLLNRVSPDALAYVNTFFETPGR